MAVNKGDPRDGAGPFANLVSGNPKLETPNGCAYADNSASKASRQGFTLEDGGASNQVRWQGARTGTAPCGRYWKGNMSGM